MFKIALAFIFGMTDTQRKNALQYGSLFFDTPERWEQHRAYCAGRAFVRLFYKGNHHDHI